jgi:hypothetical protein
MMRSSSTVFIGWDGVMTGADDADGGWRVRYHNHMEDDVLSNGALDIRHLY